MGSLRAGSRGWWPVTASRARPRSSRGRAARAPARPGWRSPPSIGSSNYGRSWPAKASTTGRTRSPGTWNTTMAWPCGGHHPPAPARGRADHPSTAEAAQIVLHPVRRRTTQRDAGRPTSPTGGWPTAPTSRSSTGSTTTPATRSQSPRTAASPAPSCSMPSAMPLPLTASRLPHSPTTAWSSPPGWPAPKAAATDWRTSWAAWAWSRSTPPPLLTG